MLRESRLGASSISITARNERTGLAVHGVAYPEFVSGKRSETNGRQQCQGLRSSRRGCAPEQLDC